MWWRLVGPSLGVLAALGSERTSPYPQALHLRLFYSVLVTPRDPGEPHTVPAQPSGPAALMILSVCPMAVCVPIWARHSQPLGALAGTQVFCP